jgi:predicted nucleic acid-binding Zn ribbon protein
LQRKDPSGPRPIAEEIRLFLRASGLRRPSADQRVFRAWTEAAGEEWKEHATPVSFRNGQLTVEVSSSVRLQELRGFRSEGFRARANEALGEPLIRKVVYKPRS